MRLWCLNWVFPACHLPSWNYKSQVSGSAGLSVFVSPCLSVDSRSQTGTMQLTLKLAADWQLKSKTWKMLCFSTSQQMIPWGRIVNFNGLFSLEMCAYVCICACVCLFWSMGVLKLQQGCVGWWLHAQLIGQLGYFHATLTTSGRPASTTHTLRNTHLLKAKHKMSLRQMLPSPSEL